MAWKTSILVVANVTADSNELLSALQERAGRSPTVYTLLVPAAAGGARARRAAEQRLQIALSRAGELGLEIGGQVGDCDPILAISDIFDPRRFDEIIVSTLPAGVSRWLMVDLPARVRRQADVPVQHVVASRPRPPLKTSARPAPERRGVLSPLTPLTWGRRPQGAPAASPPRAPAASPPLARSAAETGRRDGPPS
jgi:hypothetical protein